MITAGVCFSLLSTSARTLMQAAGKYDLQTLLRRTIIHRSVLAQAKVRAQHTQAGTEAGGDGGDRHSAAAHILAQARLEEEAEASQGNIASTLSQRILEASKKDVPWQGEESIEDAVLRMLTDKYKPMRVPGTKRRIQQPSSEPFYIAPKPVLTINEHIDQTATDYKWKEGDPPRFPWEHSFRSPTSKDGSPLVKTGVLVRPASASSSVSSSALAGTSTHNKGKRAGPGQVAARVYRARDASLDYQVGSHDVAKAKVALSTRTAPKTKGKTSGSGGGVHTPMPTSIRAWNTMVEERIELAKQQGIFKDVKGRGKPMARDEQDSNPFISRTEFLMNRIIKKQEVAPPFVELQKEMREEANSFRARLRAAWIRRATRMLSLQPLTPSVVANAADFRDKEWEEREQGYYERSVDALNSIIRRYNVVAPASVRTNITTLELELKACYRDCGGLIREELERRAKAGLAATPEQVLKQGKQDGPQGKTMEEQTAVRETMLSAFRRLAREVFAKKQT